MPGFEISIDDWAPIYCFHKFRKCCESITLNLIFASRSRDTGVEPHLSSRDSMHSVERLRNCSGFTNPKDVSVFSHSDIDNSVFSTGSGPHVAEVLIRPVSAKQPSANMDYSASNEPKQPPYHKPSYLDSFEQTFSPSFLGGISDESYSGTTTNCNGPTSMRINITPQDNKHTQTKLAEMQQRIRSLQDENKKEMASVFRYDMNEIQVKLSNLCLSTIDTLHNIICPVKFNEHLWTETTLPTWIRSVIL